MPFENKKSFSISKKTRSKSCQLIKYSVSTNSAINWRAKLASEKLHCANFVHNVLIIMAVMQNHGNGQKSWNMPKITVFTVIVIYFQP